MRLLHRISLSPLWILILTLPWTVGCNPLKQYPRETWLEITGGRAQANADVPGACNRRFTLNYLDLGASVQHSFPQGITLVAGGGYVSTLSVSEARGDSTEPNPRDEYHSLYLQTRVRFHWENGALDLGILGVPGSLPPDEQRYYMPPIYPIVRVRFGLFDEFYGTVGTMRSAAYIASGSLADIGIGYLFKDIKTNAWLGFGAHPNFTNSQLIAEAECEATSYLRLKGSFNYGIHDTPQSATEPQEFGFSFGISMRLQ